MVSRDANGDGIPNDDWYELAGSEYRKDTTVHNYQITYYRPKYDSLIRNGGTPDIAYINSPASFRTAAADSNIADVYWKDNLGRSGYVLRNGYHRQQSYYPMWIEADSLVFSGSLVASNLRNTGTATSQAWISPAFDWGYVDNWSNGSTDDKTSFKIDWAVDKYGNPVNLPQIDFIKVYTAANGDGGWLGELSTEFAGIQDLHSEVSLTASDDIRSDCSTIPLGADGKATITYDEATTSFTANNLIAFSHFSGYNGTYWEGFTCSKKEPDLAEPAGLYNTDGSVNSSIVSTWERGNASNGIEDINEFAAVPGNGSTPYLLGYWSGFSLAGNDCNKISFTDGHVHTVRGAYVTNIACAYISMKYGDGFGKKFGGTNGTDNDFLRLIAIGKNGATETGRDTVYLADFRSQYVCDDYLVKDWTWMDLSSLGEVTHVQFIMESSDNSPYGYGPNTPTYFAMRDLTVEATTSNGLQPVDDKSIELYPNPATDYTIVSAPVGSHIDLYSTNGMKVRSVSAISERTRISLTGLNAGTYIITVSGTTSKVLKLIVK